ncbi:MAG: hypothetical protein P4L44_12905 [Oryzomonas sp.]|uniref:hypothetical protein n=1 Tax=Oryzomonas sp. TaxID=2855186 RepID=UPI0028453541|nr:hypothetical protein [Oryzomonas sp.]MDR3580853.1 hypothetical protein [Oryzomonas sp.]
MNDKLIIMESRILTTIFFVFLLTAIVLVSKATLAALKINSSTAYSITYFALFGAGVLFTKYIYYSMFRVYQYAALAITAAIGGLCFLWLQYLH